MKSARHDFRVCIDARIISGALGGVEQFIIGLADGLSKLQDGDEQYLFLTYQGMDDWLKPYIQGSCKILYGTAATRQPGWIQVVKKVPGMQMALNKIRPWAPASKRGIPRSDGLLEQSDIDIMHFPMQNAFLTSLLSIYHPWDLQHLHLPEFFTAEEYDYREMTYRAFCEQAAMVCAAASWSKRDFCEKYNLPDDKVQVVPPAPVLSVYPSPSAEDVADTKQRLMLPNKFLFYPAQTWAHKNHLRLLDAMALLRDREGLIIHLIASGRNNEYFPTIEGSIRALQLDKQVRFLGFVSPLELQCLYQLSHAMIFPSKFEGFGLPLVEAFLAGTPVACSNVTVLPSQANGATLIFDPDNTEQIAEAVRRLWTDEELCHTLIEKGKQRAACFDWQQTARLFRAHYRRIANRTLTTEDLALLNAPPII